MAMPYARAPSQDQNTGSNNMQTLFSIEELRATLQEERANGKRIGFVPTMGNLHEGHLALVRQAVSCCDIVVASIFVNPLQFGMNEDLDNYPRTLQADQDKLISAGCDYLFAPSDEVMYPNGREEQTQVEVPLISDIHCGASRPGHFQGVATVVCKLFGIVQPDVAVFGEKDYQQLMVIRRMVEHLYLPVEVQGAPIARNEDGLALSSRNGYLNEEQMKVAPTLHRTLQEAKEEILGGRRDYKQLEDEAYAKLETVGFSRDFFNICDAHTLTPANAETQQLVILAAAPLGGARLIDNVVIEL